ncbi:hypothetical protein HK405_014410 [Cladochytrium tenue]|nr:hypothetical protein HK405_014410 [Cladochytrium tenue]
MFSSQPRHVYERLLDQPVASPEASQSPLLTPPESHVRLQILAAPSVAQRPTKFRDIKLVGVPIESALVKVELGTEEEDHASVDEEGGVADAGDGSTEAAASNSEPDGVLEPKNADDEEDDRPLSSRSSTEPAAPVLVKVPGTEKAQPLVDTVHSSCEDPFTLESFEMSIRNHARAGKNFIIARVATLDSVDNKRHYHYYSAHQINKVLFRTQPEEPLNNLTVVGDVHYFAIDATQVINHLNRLHFQFLTHQAQSNLATSGFDMPTTGEPLSERISRIFHALISPALDVIQPTRADVHFRASRDRPSTQMRTSTTWEGFLTEVVSIMAPPPPPAAVDLTATARSGSLESVDGAVSPGAASDAQEHSPLLTKAREAGDRHGRSASTSTLSSVGPNRRRSADDVFSLASAAAAAAAAANAAAAPTAALDGSGATAKVAGGVVRPADGDDDGAADQAQRQYDSVEDWYVAEYVGSDDDFLYKAAMRAYFRLHALEADDAVLFTLPPDPVGAAPGAAGDDAGTEAEGAGARAAVARNGWLVRGRAFRTITWAYFVLCYLIVRVAGKLSEEKST